MWALLYRLFYATWAAYLLQFLTDVVCRATGMQSTTNTSFKDLAASNR
jgi:hypothetical protein